MEILNKRKAIKALNHKQIYFNLAIAFVVIMIFFPNVGRFKYSYQIGRPWLYETLISPIDFPILKSAKEMQDEKTKAAESIVPYYILNGETEANQIQYLNKMHSFSGMPSDFEAAIAGSLGRLYEKGIIDENGSSEYVYVKRGSGTVKQLVSQLYTKNSALLALQTDMTAAFPEFNVDSALNIINIKSLIVPNVTFDQSTTELMHKRVVDDISPTKGTIYAGELIISKGEIVTPETAQILDSYKSEYRNSVGGNGDKLLISAGHMMFVFILLLLVTAAVFFGDIDVLPQWNKFDFILFIVVLIFIITVMVNRWSSSYLFMVPYAVFALYMVAFFDTKLVFPVYMVSLLPVLLISEFGVELYVINVVGGGVTLLAFRYLHRGWKQFLNSLLIFIGMMTVYFSFKFPENAATDSLNFTALAYLLLNALLVVACYPLVFLLEKMFSLVSNSTLRDLSDTNNALLQELARLAPGTFQHSLQVANLAERAVKAIGGDSRLVKVGAMYHDVGKIYNPQCFIENEAPGVNYHKGLSPMESAQEIIKHVDMGVEYARKYSLPKVIIEFITSHHGQSQTAYFYNKYCNEGGDPANVDKFTYHGTLPTSREQVVVMMADAVEATARSLSDYSPKSISDMVESILSKRISDSQLAQADITIKEINIVKEVFKRQLAEIYHTRIAYPQKNKDYKSEVKVNETTE
ncbi:MAG: HDIG domain-containing protein [Bacteroidales bacterium]|jgi:putative nucleotidyltransferase with HDIG domain|nr:HDIG domain-containing protein [Bacteroidales bacterium]